ncbi:hypothetical protein KFU94_06435 [Chloroflexi bacterium TSY]|nr:hypothetical protein [Chloroflexi bacterium TSY]
MRNIALLLVGLQQAGGIHLSLIVRKWPGMCGKEPSLVNRLRRFLNNPQVEVRRWYEVLAKMLVTHFAGQRIRLIIDCSKVGFNYRTLTISLAYKKRALPLVWSVHRGRKGHVRYQKQLELFEYVHQLLPDASDIWVLGDAGIESAHLMGWLRDHGWHFVLRHPGKNQVRWAGQDWIKLGDIPIAGGQIRYIGWVYLTEKHDADPFWLIIHWAKGEDEPWFLIADCAGKRQLISLYAIRMWTEEMYGDMKGHGLTWKPLILMTPTASLALSSLSGSTLSGLSPPAHGSLNAACVTLWTTSAVETKAIFVSAGTGLNALFDLIFLSLFISRLISESDMWLDL